MGVDAHGLPNEIASMLRKDTLTPDELRTAQLRLTYEHYRVSLRTQRLLYNKTHPVDIWENIPAGTLSAQLQADYGVEKIGFVIASVPLGATSAVLNLGQRVFPLYNGPALATQLLVSSRVEMILNETDYRILTLTGTTTTAGYIALAGYALERFGNK
jgi:hypothetical protein